MVDLIVPTASNIGGRAAKVRVGGENVGGAVARFGQQVFNNGMKIRDEQDARELSQARIDMQLQLGQLRQEFDNISDPTALNQGFPDRIAETRANLIGGLTDRLQGRAGMAFDELANRHATAIGGRAIALHQSTLRANLDEARRIAVAGAGNTDEATRTTNVTTFSESVVDAVTTGALTPEQAGARVEGFTREQDLTAANDRLADDPAGLADALGNGEYAGVTGTQRTALQARAASAAEKAATQAARQTDAIASNQLGLVIKAANQGRVAQSEQDILDTPEFRDNPKFGEALAAVQLRDERPEMAQMTPDQLRSAIAEERGKTIANGYDNDRLAAMQSILKEAEKGWRDDPIARAQGVGLPAPAAPEDLANADPQELVQFFANRAAFAGGLVEDGYTDSPVFFSTEERDQITALTAADQDPADRVQLAAMLSAGFGDNAQQALENLGADAVFTNMSAIIADGGNSAIAERAFRGQQAIEAGNVDMPSTAEARDQIFKGAENLFQGVVGGDAIVATVRETANAIYAAGANGVASDPASAAFSAAYQLALSQAIGGDTNARNEQTGGIQGFGFEGQKTIMPVGMATSEAQSALDTSIQAFDTEGADAMDMWRTASASGELPMFGNEQLTAEMIPNLSFKAVGNGIYIVFYTPEGMFGANGNPHQLEAGNTSAPYIFDMRAFVEDSLP